MTKMMARSFWLLWTCHDKVKYIIFFILIIENQKIKLITKFLTPLSFDVLSELCAFLTVKKKTKVFVVVVWYIITSGDQKISVDTDIVAKRNRFILRDDSANWHFCCCLLIYVYMNYFCVKLPVLIGCLDYEKCYIF